MAMSPRKKEAGAGGTGGSAVNIGNAAPGGKKPKKMMRGGPAKKSGVKKMRMGGSTSRADTPTGGRTRNATPAAMAFKKNYPGLSKRLGLKAGGPVKKMRGGPMKKAMGGVAKKSGVIKKMRGGPIKKK